MFILDDDDVTNHLTKLLLEDVPVIKNYAFESNGWNALDYLETCRQSNNFPDLILVDLKMPIMDGFEFISHYEQKYWEEFPETQVMVLTSSISERDKNRVKQFKSVKEFINKPLTEEKIIEIASAEI